MMIVSNTTPLSNFLHLDRFDILRQMFQTLHIPKAVKYELDIVFAMNLAWQQCLSEGLIVVHDIQPTVLLQQDLVVLHRGEAEALWLCIEHHAQLCLIDDKDARMVAILNGIKTSGTLSVLIQAKQRGMIATVQPFMDTLRNQHHFWISPAMYAKVLALSHEQ